MKTENGIERGGAAPAGGLTRRGFIGGIASVGAFGGCRSLGLGGDAQLRLGVISDIHVTTPESDVKFRRALAYFRRRGADAVVVAGDLADWGLRSSLGFVKAAWDAEMAGSGIVPLFITGNHDFEGWWYGDMTLDMHVQGYSEDEALSRLGMKKCWEEVFGEPYAEIRHRKVKGFDFVSAEWSEAKGGNDAQGMEWFKAHRGELASDRPVFFMRHEPLPGTVSSAAGRGGTMQLTEFLKTMPNIVSLTGHTHWTLNDERSIWQGGGLTAISIPSMSYTTIPRGYENGSGPRKPDCRLSMSRLPSRDDLEAAQGFFVTIRPGAMEVERRDFEDGEEAAPPWVVPMSAAAGRPYEPSEHAKKFAAPSFPAGTFVNTYTTNADRRNGTWAIFLTLEFPAATAPGDSRVFDYEARAVMEDGTVAAVKRFMSPGFYKTRRHEPKTLKFRFDGMDLPERGRYRIHVVARNCFGDASAPIVSLSRESVPGKDKAKYRSWQ